MVKQKQMSLTLAPPLINNSIASRCDFSEATWSGVRELQITLENSLLTPITPSSFGVKEGMDCQVRFLTLYFVSWYLLLSSVVTLLQLSSSDKQNSLQDAYNTKIEFSVSSQLHHTCSATKCEWLHLFKMTPFCHSTWSDVVQWIINELTHVWLHGVAS